MRLLITDRFGVMLDVEFPLPGGLGATGLIEDARLKDIVRGLAITQGIVDAELVMAGMIVDCTARKEGPQTP